MRVCECVSVCACVPWTRTCTGERECACVALLEEAPGQDGGQAVEHAGGQVEDGAEAGLQRRGPPPVDHHHLVDLLRVLVGQEGAEGDPGPADGTGTNRTE